MYVVHQLMYYTTLCVYIYINLYFSVLYIILKFQLELPQPTNSLNYLKILVFNLILSKFYLFLVAK